MFYCLAESNHLAYLYEKLNDDAMTHCRKTANRAELNYSQWFETK